MPWRRALRGLGPSVASAIAILIAACAQGQDGIDLGSGGAPSADAGADARLPAQSGADAKAGGADGGAPGACPKPAGCSGKIVINELQVNGASNAEFVELYNPNDCAVALDGWKLLYRSSGDNPGGTLYAFDAGDSIASGELVVLGSSSFQGPKQHTLGPASMGNSGGQVGLVDGANDVIDAVGYSPGTAGAYTEKAPAPNPESGAIGRSCGADTGDNSKDFVAYAQHSAGAPNP